MNLFDSRRHISFEGSLYKTASCAHLVVIEGNYTQYKTVKHMYQFWFTVTCAGGRVGTAESESPVADYCPLLEEKGSCRKSDKY